MSINNRAASWSRFHDLFFNWHLTSTPFSAYNNTSNPLSASNWTSSTPKQNSFHIQNAKMWKLFEMVQSCRTLSFLVFDPVLNSYAEPPDFPSIEGVQTGISVNEHSPSKVKKLWIMPVILLKWQKYYLAKIYSLNLVSSPLLQIGTCEVKNGFPKPNITWYRNNMPLLGDQDGEMDWHRHQWFPSTLFYFVLNAL